MIAILGVMFAKPQFTGQTAFYAWNEYSKVKEVTLISPIVCSIL